MKGRCGEGKVAGEARRRGQERVVIRVVGVAGSLGSQAVIRRNIVNALLVVDLIRYSRGHTSGRTDGRRDSR